MTLGLLWGIWAAINVIVFVLYGVEKRRAIRGAWLAMRIFRHKTKHIAFQVSAPISAILSLLLMLLASARLLNLI